MNRFTGQDITDLELILLRAKAQITSDRNDANRLFVAYGDERPGFGHRIDAAKKAIETIDRLLPLVRALRGYDAR